LRLGDCPAHLHPQAVNAGPGSGHLAACPDIGILDKNEEAALVASLDLRNGCGHPTKYEPGPKKVSAFIEDVRRIVFA
jgi:hypothetical protein